ncbi:MAG: hypothetical protein IPL99_27010 [Candidatus Competibacteraceae bacterium]|nr:hypothetical protein [Candidatus Competibacteraceae bacterium]
MILVLAGVLLAGWLHLHWAGVVLVVPLLFLAALAFATLGLLFTALVPSIDHMDIPSSWSSCRSASPAPISLWKATPPGPQAWLILNPLHHLAEGIRFLCWPGEWNSHLLAAWPVCADDRRSHPSRRAAVAAPGVGRRLRGLSQNSPLILNKNLARNPLLASFNPTPPLSRSITWF